MNHVRPLQMGDDQAQEGRYRSGARQGLFQVHQGDHHRSAVAEDVLIELALEAGADDVNTEGETYEVLTPPVRFEAVKEAITAKSIPVSAAEITKLASVQVPVSEKDAEALLRLVDALE